MLTTDRAMEVVRLVNNALVRPEEALAREDMGAMHAALAPHLRNWAVSSQGLNRDVLMVSAVGSVNYDLVVETSDLDMKAVYLPDFQDFYRGKFPKFSLVTDDFDCELHPAPAFCNHALKGNINFFEPLYARACLATPDFILIMHKHLRPLVEMNIAMTALATFFTAEQQNKGANAEAGQFFNSKKGAMAIRCLVFLINLLDTGEFVLRPGEPFREQILRLKRGEMPWHEYVGLYQELHDTAQKMTFYSMERGVGHVLSDRVNDLDEKDSPEWNELRADMDNQLMTMVRRHIEMEHRDQLLEAGWKTR